jgi:hypothetical protein
VVLDTQKMPPKRKKAAKKTKFLVKHRTALITDLEKDDHADAVVDKLPTGLHLQRYESRNNFVTVLCGDNAKEALIRCVKFMVKKVLDLYKEYMKGKRFMQFEQAWMEHIHTYFTCPEIQGSTLDSYIVWQAVVDKCECSISEKH